MDSMAFVVNKDIYGVATVTITTPLAVTRTHTVTVTTTTTATITSPSTVTTTTVTRTRTQTITRTSTVTTTTTVAVTKPAWPVVWEACYDISDNIYVSGTLLEPVSEKESVPYVVKFYDCTILGCSLLAVKPFEWTSKSSFEAKYYLPDPKPLHTYRIEIWSVDWEKGETLDKVYEQTIDTSIRCA